MTTSRFSIADEDKEAPNLEEYETGYVARIAGQPQCLSATPGWRAGWADADAGFSSLGYKKTREKDRLADRKDSMSLSSDDVAHS